MPTTDSPCFIVNKFEDGGGGGGRRLYSEVQVKQRSWNIPGVGVRPWTGTTPCEQNDWQTRLQTLLSAVSLSGGNKKQLEILMTTPLYHFEEFIPVGCVPPALYRTGGVSLSGGIFVQGGRGLCQGDSFPLCEENDWQTGVKTLPSCKFVCGR